MDHGASLRNLGINKREKTCRVVRVFTGRDDPALVQEEVRGHPYMGDNALNADNFGVRTHT